MNIDLVDIPDSIMTGVDSVYFNQEAQLFLFLF
jgi:hypothetical protein